MSQIDPLRINLSLVSHTNIGKTTLARTLLSKDVGEIADRAHVTETADDFVLARDNLGAELVLWDTPGFGNSVQLASRLAARSNPLGWFLSEVWDRFTNKAFWLNQMAIKHVKETSSVVLYLVNVSELPDSAPYIKAEMSILSWIGKPVIVLLNQMGEPRPKEEEEKDVEDWENAMSSYPLVKAVLPLDAFARCWVQEVVLFDEIQKALPESLQSSYSSLRSIWERSRRAVYSSSVDALASHVWRQLVNKEVVAAPSLKDQMLTLAKRFGFLNKDDNALSDARAALNSAAADSFCRLTNQLISINGISGKGAGREILRRMKNDWSIQRYSMDAGSAAAVGGGIGFASGAAAGAAADFASAGISLGLGSIIGGILGAVGGLGAATLYNSKAKKEGLEIAWSSHAVSEFTIESVLLYLAVAHFGRGRGDWVEGESPLFWKDSVVNAVKDQPIDFESIRRMNADEGIPLLTRKIDSIIRSVFSQLYGRSI